MPEEISTARKKVFLVDDHPMVREHLAQLIAQQPDLEICGEAVDLPQALEGIEATEPDLAIVDISLRASSGLDLVKEIRARDWTLPVLVLSMHEETLYAERALRAGALGYVSKQESSKNILCAIRRVMDHQTYVSAEVSNRFIKRAVGASARNEVLPLSSLGDRELEVFQLIGRGMGTKQISETLGIGVKTVETYRARIKEKLHLEDGVQLLRQAIRWVEDYDSGHPK